MRLLGVLAVGCLGVNAATAATLALWPQQLDAKLSHFLNAVDGSAVLEASDGGALGTFSVKIDAQSETPLHPLVDAIEITWVPAVEARSSMFDRYMANSLRFDGVDAVGIHLQVKLVNEAAWSEISETYHERIEENVRAVLQNTLPTIGILSGLSKGFLAKSLCDFRAWKTSDPLGEVLRERVDGSPSLCYSSSFPFSSQREGATFFSKIVREDKVDSVDSRTSKMERALREAKQSSSTIQREHRFVVVKLSRGSASPAYIEAEYLEAWFAGPSSADNSWKAVLPIDDTKTDVLVVTSITGEAGLDKIEYSWLQRAGRKIALETPSILEIQVPKSSVSASVQTAIAGEGFHRRYVMDVNVHESKACGRPSEQKEILVRVPVSNTAYIDLDEIRRMERFGELKLLSFTKHIEIERPSPVSSQHVVGLEFTIPPSSQTHIEFPIHFRYQAPSESDLYRQSSVIAPDMFLFCQNGDRSALIKPTIWKDSAAQSYFQTWGLTGETNLAASSDGWLRLTTGTPLPVTEVLTPVGYLPSDWLVSSVTLLFAIMGAALLLWVSLGVAKLTQSSSTTARANWKAKIE